MNILITAGPTREWIDDIRFISNPSSGRMGFACAEEARRRGHRVTLICGPVPAAPPGAIRVETTADMLREVRRRFARCDALIMTAAVADFAPARRRGKIKKRPRMTLGLRQTPDILATLARRKGRRIFVGFAVESRDLERFAREKMRRKRMDFVVANPPSAFGAARSTVVILDPTGGREVMRRASKRAIARRILRRIGAQQ